MYHIQSIKARSSRNSYSGIESNEPSMTDLRLLCVSWLLLAEPLANGIICIGGLSKPKAAAAAAASGERPEEPDELTDLEVERPGGELVREETDTLEPVATAA